ncbi:MAG: hypothetical protein M1526_05140 [Candidatus Thermoplasmatota archaeon]|jgi:transcription initiation factor IIE alpha subunit|nr:hypothetical protein [Candidatus Thermoplasmatota archaeon]MCL5681314.1 hypothetical protein [Candidatus Thermoplasmatota archaeon]
MAVIKRDELVTALEILFKPSGMNQKEIVELADYVLSFFGYEDTLIDNVLSQQDRDVFYTLEETGILSTSSEDITLMKGKSWRIHYWHISGDKIRNILKKSQVEEENIYDKLFREGFK